MKNSRISAFLRWAGSKKQLLPILQEYWVPTHKRYVEPFAGSACLFFRIGPSKSMLGDLNAALIKMYRCLKSEPEAVIDALFDLPKGRRHYQQIRSMDATDMSDAGRAARFIYLNRFCFNGLYRTNKLGNFNVPYGGGKSGSLPSRELLRACSASLRRTILLDGDFGDTLARVVAGDFVYLDPPFSVAARRTFNEYNAAVFASADVKRLREWMHVLVSRGASFVVSYAESEEGRFLARGFATRRVTVKRHIAGSFTNRVKSRELLIHHRAI
jgi:DNA adenine methylase